MARLGSRGMLLTISRSAEQQLAYRLAGVAGAIFSASRRVTWVYMRLVGAAPDKASHAYDFTMMAYDFSRRDSGTYAHSRAMTTDCRAGLSMPLSGLPSRAPTAIVV